MEKVWYGLAWLTRAVRAVTPRRWQPHRKAFTLWLYMRGVKARATRIADERERRRARAAAQLAKQLDALELCGCGVCAHCCRSVR